jgi:hypothetical protein
MRVVRSELESAEIESEAEDANTLEPSIEPATWRRSLACRGRQVSSAPA